MKYKIGDRVKMGAEQGGYYFPNQPNLTGYVIIREIINRAVYNCYVEGAGFKEDKLLIFCEDELEGEPINKAKKYRFGDKVNCTEGTVVGESDDGYYIYVKKEDIK